MDIIKLDDALKAYGKSILRKQYQPVTISISLEDGLHMIRQIGKMFKPAFVIDQDNQAAFEQLFWYFTCQFENFNGDPLKGILAVGQRGTGKTLAMVVMQHMLEFLDKTGHYWDEYFNPRFSMVKCTEIKSDFSDQENGGLKTLKQYKTRHEVYCFDDLGEEIRDQPMAIHYGVQLNVMENIMTSRAENYKVHHTLTHATSNYPIQSSDGSERYFKQFYGNRIEDRAREMFNVIVFTGESRRK